jgi:hypothetical protein
VLEALTRALAARARFSLERFSDVYLISRAIAAHVRSVASRGRISFALGAGEQQLDLTIGPLRIGAGEHLSGRVAALAGELAIEPLENSELLRVVLADRQLTLRRRRKPQD